MHTSIVSTGVFLEAGTIMIVFYVPRVISTASAIANRVLYTCNSPSDCKYNHSLYVHTREISEASTLRYTTMHVSFPTAVPVESLIVPKPGQYGVHTRVHALSRRRTTGKILR